MTRAWIMSGMAATAMLAGCGSVEIEDLAGCYQIEDAHAFQLGRDYRVIVNGQVVAQMRMSETDGGARFDSRPGIMAVGNDEEGYSVTRNPATPDQIGAVQETLFGTPYFLLPTDNAETPEIEAYLIEGAEC